MVRQDFVRVLKWVTIKLAWMSSKEKARRSGLWGLGAAI